MKTINWSDFEQVELRVGTVVKVESFEKTKKPALKVWVDFGVFGILQTSAQITAYYTAETLVGRQVVGCINLGEKNIAGFVSQFLLIGAPDASGAIRLIGFDGYIPNGNKLC